MKRFVIVANVFTLCLACLLIVSGIWSSVSGASSDAWPVVLAGVCCGVTGYRVFLFEFGLVKHDRQ